MATVLFGWEMGEGLGHVQPLLAVARSLAERGHRPVFALKNLIESWPVLRDQPYAVLQAPIWHRRLWRGDKPFTASSFADVLAIAGYERADDLHPLVEGWQRLIDLIQPSLIVADYCPTLCLAAYRTLPVVQIGAWFEMPPAEGQSFALLVPGQAPFVSQEQVLAAIQEVQRRRNRPVPTTLPEFLAGDRFVVTLRELDGYKAYRREPLWDPLTPLPPATPPPAQPGFFAYLNGDYPNLEAVLTHLAMSGCPGRAYIRSLPADLAQRLRLQGIEVLTAPAAMEEVLAQSAVIVHHAGAGTSQAALSGGRPQLVIPLHLEQTMNAQLLQRLGVGGFLAGSFAPEAAARQLQQVLGDRRFSDNALAVAQRLNARERRDPLPAIVERCLQILTPEREREASGGG